jgi:hypothetical protein
VTHPLEAALAGARNPRLLAHCFPVLRGLDILGCAQFERLAWEIGTHPNMRVELVGRDVDAVETDTGARLIAGHLAEVFFARQDILERLLSRPRRFVLYESLAHFKADGGIGGGCYDPKRTRIQLLRDRMFEGFDPNAPEYAPPGVAPFLHELGHLLDHFDPASGHVRHVCDGLLPGLRPEDGAVFSPDARALFLTGRQIERERYAHWRNGRPRAPIPMPLGHPYVFQNDGEFCAGYFEMFFRNPHAMADANPELFAGYVMLFARDPRDTLAYDFPFYLVQNRAYYLSR